MEKKRRLYHLVARGVNLLSGPASATLVLTSWFTSSVANVRSSAQDLNITFLSKRVYSLLIREYWSFCQIAHSYYHKYQVKLFYNLGQNA